MGGLEGTCMIYYILIQDIWTLINKLKTQVNTILGKGRPKKNKWAWS